MKLVDGAITIKPFDYRPRLIVRVGGLEKQGKTHFALTAPPPICFFDLNDRSEGVVDKFVGHKEIQIFKFRKKRATTQKDWQLMWDTFQKNFWTFIDADFRTGILDTETDLWEIRRLAEFGRESSVPQKYGGLNKDIRNIYEAVNSTDKNFIVLSERKKKYVDHGVDKRGNKISTWDGSYEMAGWGNTGYKVQVNLITEFDPVEQVFNAEILNCGLNPMIVGAPLTGTAMCNFPFLATMIFPTTSLEDWT